MQVCHWIFKFKMHLFFFCTLQFSLKRALLFLLGRKEHPQDWAHDQTEHFDIIYTKDEIKVLKEYALKVAEPKVDYVTSYECIVVLSAYIQWLYYDIDVKDIFGLTVFNARNRAEKCPGNLRGNLILSSCPYKVFVLLHILNFFTVLKGFDL